MNWLSILAKLEQAKQLLTQTAPDAIDRAAEAVHNLEEAMREAAAFLRTYQGTATASEDDAEAVERFEAFEESCREATTVRGAAPVGGWEQLLIPVILEVTKRILDRLKDRRNQPA